MTVVGTSDHLSPVRDADRYAGPDGKAPVLVIAGAGHVIFNESPDALNRAMIQFLGSHSRHNYIMRQDE